MHPSLSLSLSFSLSPLFFLSALFQRTTLASDHFLQNNRPLRSSSQGATVQRALRQSLHALQVPSTGCFEYTSLLCQHVILMSFVSPQRLTSNPLTRALYYLLLQGNTLPSRGPRHPRPAPLVLQVPFSQYVIDWDEDLGVLGLPTPLLHAMPYGFLSLLRTVRVVKLSSRRLPDHLPSPFLLFSPSLPLLLVCSLKKTALASFHRRCILFRFQMQRDYQPPPPPPYSLTLTSYP